MFLFVHVGELEFVFLFSMYCIRDYAFICPRRFIFDLFGQVGAFGFTFLFHRVDALEFMLLFDHAGAFGVIFHQRTGVCVFFGPGMRPGKCFVHVNSS